MADTSVNDFIEKMKAAAGGFTETDSKPKLTDIKGYYQIDDEKGRNLFTVANTQSQVLLRVIAANAVAAAPDKYNANPHSAVGAQMENSIVDRVKNKVLTPLDKETQFKFDEYAKDVVLDYFKDFAKLAGKNIQTGGKQQAYMLSKDEVLMALGAKVDKLDPKNPAKVTFDKKSAAYGDAVTTYEELLGKMNEEVNLAKKTAEKTGVAGAVRKANEMVYKQKKAEFEALLQSLGEPKNKKFEKKAEEKQSLREEDEFAIPLDVLRDAKAAVARFDKAKTVLSRPKGKDDGLAL